MEKIALIIKQWLDEWDRVVFSEKEHQSKPQPYFYQFSMSAKDLNRFSDIHRRDKSIPRSEDPNIQRSHDESRSSEIKRFVKYGYPCSTKSITKFSERDIEKLQKPGWLPTAIVVNILRNGDSREKKIIKNSDLVQIIDNIDSGTAKIIFPEVLSQEGVRPIEIIDGQHRLKAFEESGELSGDFELPVVAFHGLDISWQAYLFWVINIKPKRITPSLAYDLYPLLRRESWLNENSDLIIYRESRAQEIADLLWSYPRSPWYQKINMLGDRSGGKNITQAALVNSLLSSFVKRSVERGSAAGGLFGDSAEGPLIPWNRSAQAAFIILFLQLFYFEVITNKQEWLIESYASQNILLDDDYENYFFNDRLLINSDQGFRGILQVFNSIMFYASTELNLQEMYLPECESIDENERLDYYIDEFKRNADLLNLLLEIAFLLNQFDWRSSKDYSIKDPSLLYQKKSYRGGSGYRQIREDIINVMDQNPNKSKILKLIFAYMNMNTESRDS